MNNKKPNPLTDIKPKKKVSRDRFRNKFIRWLGVLPLDDFDWYANDVIAVLESFEKFTLETKRFAAVVSDKLNLVKTDEVPDAEFEERDMYQ